MTLTIQEAREKEGLLNSLLTSDNDKLNYAIKKNLKSLQRAINPLIETYNEGVNNVRVKLAAVHEDGEHKGHFLLNEKGEYTFTKENTILFNIETKGLLKLLLNAPAEFPTDFKFFFAEEDWPRVSDVDLFLKEELAGVLFNVVCPQGWHKDGNGVCVPDVGKK